MKYPNLFSRTNIGQMRLKNRVIMCPMGNKTDPDGGVSERNIDYFVERAKGGVSAVFTGSMFCTEKYETRGANLLDRYDHVDRLGLLADKLHHYDCKLVVQITPGLGRMGFTDPNTPPYAPSAIPTFYFKDLICKEYTAEQIKELVHAMGNTAKLAKTAGADAVEIHAYGGYLIDQFQTAAWNIRTDEYGGSFENRMRFTTEIIQEVRRVCGDRYPIIVKFTPYHGVEGYRELDEGLKMAQLFESLGVDALHVDVGCYEAWYKAIPTVYEEDGCQLFVTREVRKVVDLPLITQGKLDNPILAESVIEEGTADIIGLGHQMLCDPYWVNKVKNGEEARVVPCIGCNECMFTSRQGLFRHCAVNPRCYHEKDYPILKTETPKNVLVVGGGPGGLSAALAAAEAGHHVTLAEREDRLGGTLIAAGAPEFKQDVMKYVDYIVREVNNSAIDVKLGQNLDLDSISGYDAVIMATGSNPIIPPIPGVDRDQVITSTEALVGEPLTGDVVIIGGGLVGCETALHTEKTAESVTIVEILDELLLTVEHNLNNDQSLRNKIAESAINIYMGTKAVEIQDNIVVVEKSGEKIELPYDHLVLATGYRPNNQMVDELEDTVPFFRCVGDATFPRKIVNAVHEGFHAGRLV